MIKLSVLSYVPTGNHRSQLTNLFNGLNSCKRRSKATFLWASMNRIETIFQKNYRQNNISDGWQLIDFRFWRWTAFRIVWRNCPPEAQPGKDNNYWRHRVSYLLNDTATTLRWVIVAVPQYVIEKWKSQSVWWEFSKDYNHTQTSNAAVCLQCCTNTFGGIKLTHISKVVAMLIQFLSMLRTEHIKDNGRSPCW